MMVNTRGPFGWSLLSRPSRLPEIVGFTDAPRTPTPYIRPAEARALRFTSRHPRRKSITPTTAVSERSARSSATSTTHHQASASSQVDASPTVPILDPIFQRAIIPSERPLEPPCSDSRDAGLRGTRPQMSPVQGDNASTIHLDQTSTPSPYVLERIPSHGHRWEC